MEWSFLSKWDWVPKRDGYPIPSRCPPLVCRLRKNPLVKRRRHYDDNNNNNVFMASSSELLPSSSWNSDGELLQDQGMTSFPVQTEYGEESEDYGVSNLDRFGSGSGSNCNDDDDDMTHRFLMDSLDLSDPPWVDFFRQE
ncbi:unnamed protein product [Linum trigynum]|uniref:Uncharacterized protein n=1 Tax=Linum trigynum TaxID=586398 RepID=A0AAV2DHI3_9ROSI